MLFREGVLYEMSYKNRTCRKMPLRSPFQPLGIPHNATLQAQVILRSSSEPGQGLLVNNWIRDIPERKEKYFLTFTEFGCIPISSLYTPDEFGWTFISFYDMVIGIEDPLDFIPPDFCDTTQPVDEGGEAVTDFFEALLRKDDQ